MLYIIIAIVGFIVFFLLFAVFGRMFTDIEQKKAEEADVKLLIAKIEKLTQQQTEIDTRLTNIEHIIADDRFQDPPEPRQAIDLKREMDDLKILIERIAKK